MLGSSEGQGGTEAHELVEGCLLWGGELSWTGCHYWRDTAGGGNFATGMEVVVVVGEEGELA